jgi:Flp pilus assembly protein TadB
MIVMALLGAGIGAGLFLLVFKLFPPKTSPLTELAQFDAHRRAEAAAELIDSSASGSARTANLEGRIGRWVAAELQMRGLRYMGLRQDLLLTGKSFDALMGRKVVAGVGGFLLALLATSWLQFGRDVHLPTGAPLAVALIVAAIAFLAPDVDIRKEAKRRREEFKEDLATYLELVSLEMVGYAAAETALPTAAQLGGTWSMLLIRETLQYARDSGENTWDALAGLGQRIGVPDLRELGSLIKNVADDGAQVRQTLSARAASMRRARLASEEGNAEERNQSMRLAQLGIALGFMLFVGWPAFVNIKF